MAPAEKTAILSYEMRYLSRKAWTQSFQRRARVTWVVLMTTLLQLLEDLKQTLDKNHYVADIHMDLSKTFDIACHMISY